MGFQSDTPFHISIVSIKEWRGKQNVSKTIFTRIGRGKERRKESQIGTWQKHVERLSPANPLAEYSKRSASSQDGVTGTGFTSLTKTTEKPVKTCEGQFSDIGHQAS